MQKQFNVKAQNRIDYIVYHDIRGASKILESYGFEPPENTYHLVEAVKELIRKKGRKVIKQLLSLHPDKDTILKLNSSPLKNICDACNNDSYNEQTKSCRSCGHSKYLGAGDEYNFLSQFEDYKDHELQKYYKRIVKQSNAKPEDKDLSREVQMVWNELRLRKQQSNKQVQSKPTDIKAFSPTKQDLIIAGIIFITGIVIGNGLQFKKNS